MLNYFMGVEVLLPSLVMIVSKSHGSLLVMTNCCGADCLGN